MNIRRFLRKSERGQAMTEYAVLFPPVLLLSMMFLIPVTERANYIFCRMVNSLDPTVCEAWIEEPEEEEAAPSEEICVTLLEDGGSQCDQHTECTVLPGLNYGSFDASKDIQGFVIKAGQEYHIYESGVTHDGCYSVDIAGNHVTWEKIGSVSGCKDISHNQVWKVSLCQ